MSKISYPNIQVSKGMAGWFAVKVWWNPDGGFAEPYETGSGRYALQSEAIAEAEEWAENAGLPFYQPTVVDNTPARQDVEQQIKEILPDVQIFKVD